MSDERVEVVSVPGANIWTVSSGAGVPLVLCHGGPGLSDNFGPVAAMVDDLALVHRYDQRGSGRSSVAGELDVASFVADLDALRAHWGHEAWVVGGHSWGALLGLTYAVAHPDRTLGVVSIANPGLWPEQLGGQWKQRLSRLAAEEQAELKDLQQRVADGDLSGQDRLLRLVWTTDFADRARANEVLDAGPLFQFPRNDEVARAVRQSFAAVVENGFESQVAGLSVQSLHLQGDQDRSDIARKVASLMRGSEFVEFSAAGHIPWLERPSEFRLALRSFLSSVS